MIACKFSGCGKRRVSLGLCSGHYSQQYLGRRLSPLRVPGDPTPTARQREVLRLLAGGATMREVGRALAIDSTNGVADHIKALIRKGLAKGSKAAHRSGRYTVTPAGLATIGLRCCDACHGAGTVRA